MSYKEPEMWEHYCEVEHSMMGVGKGEPCNWCGKTEKDFEVISAFQVKEFDQDGMFTTEYLKGNTMAIKDELPEEDPYRNYAREAIDILNRMEKKIDALLEEQENRRDDGK